MNKFFFIFFLFSINSNLFCQNIEQKQINELKSILNIDSKNRKLYKNFAENYKNESDTVYISILDQLIKYKNDEIIYLFMELYNQSSKNKIIDSFFNKLANILHKTSPSKLFRIIDLFNNLFINKLIYSNQNFKWKLDNVLDLEFNDNFNISIIGSDIKCISKLDEISINNVYGRIDLFKDKIYVERADSKLTYDKIFKDSLKVKLKNFEIQLKKNSFNVHDAVLYQKSNNNNNIKGEFKDGLVNNLNKKIKFPHFDSYHFIEIEKFFKIDIINSKVKINNNQFLFYSDETFIKFQQKIYKNISVNVSSKKFRYIERRIFSENTSTKISFNEDSIFHPQMDFIYSYDSDSLNFKRSNNKLGLTPIYSSFHKLNFYYDNISCKKNVNKININSGNILNNPALIETNNFFNESRLYDFYNMGIYNIFFELKSLINKYKSNYYKFNFLKKYFKVIHNDLILLLEDLLVIGLIELDYESEKIKITSKLNFYLDAKFDEIDYDKIQIKAIKNSIFNLDNKDIVVNGVSKLTLSDSSNVKIIPKDNKIILKENRDISFGGTLINKNNSFYCNEFYYNYNLNLVSFKNIYLLKCLNNEKILKSELYGKLFINKNDNKSEKFTDKKYPILYLENNSKLFIPNIDNSNIAFNLNNIEIDSLNIRNNYFLNGNLKLNSLNYFTSQDLCLSKELDVTYEYKIDNKNIFKNNIEFVNGNIFYDGGFRGEGEIIYSNYIINSKKIHFYSDSLKILNGKIKESENIYNLSSNSSNIIFNKFKNNFKLTTDSLAINNLLFRGVIDVNENNLFAKGTIINENLNISSKSFVISSSNINSKKSSFFILNSSSKSKTVCGLNYSYYYDFKNYENKFKSINDSSNSIIDKNTILMLSNIKYFPNDSIIEFYEDKSEKGLINIKNSNFDKLDIFTNKLSLNLNNNEIYLYDNYININSIDIISDKFLIKENELIDILKSKLIITNNSKFKFEFKNSKIIHITNDMVLAKGTLHNFYDKKEIYFKNILLKNKRIKVTTDIFENDNFLINKNLFKGNISLNINKEEINYSGYIKTLYKERYNWKSYKN